MPELVQEYWARQRKEEQDRLKLLREQKTPKSVKGVIAATRTQSDPYRARKRPIILLEDKPPAGPHAHIGTVTKATMLKMLKTGREVRAHTCNATFRVLTDACRF